MTRLECHGLTETTVHENKNFRTCLQNQYQDEHGSEGQPAKKSCHVQHY